LSPRAKSIVGITPRVRNEIRSRRESDSKGQTNHPVCEMKLKKVQKLLMRRIRGPAVKLLTPTPRVRNEISKKTEGMIEKRRRENPETHDFTGYSRWKGEKIVDSSIEKALFGHSVNPNRTRTSVGRIVVNYCSLIHNMSNLSRNSSLFSG